MSRVLTAKTREIFLIMEQLFHYGKTTWIVVSGRSMYPFLREDIDMVELERAEISRIKRGDIVLIQRKNGEFVLHRVIKKISSYIYIVGDAQQWLEGPIQESQIKAVVINIKRKNKVISCNNMILKALVNLWFIVRPLRYKLIRIFRFAKRLYTYVYSRKRNT